MTRGVFLRYSGVCRYLDAAFGVLNLLVTSAVKEPLKNHFLFCGDLNFSALGSLPHHYKAPTSVVAPEVEESDGLSLPPNASSVTKSSFCVSRWKRFLDKRTEFSQPCPTHFHAINLSGHVIDRVFSSAPSWAVGQLKISTHTSHDPFSLHFRNISDHAPLVTTFEPKGRIPKASQPLQKHIFEDPLFTSTLDHIVFRAPLPEDPNDRLVQHKESIRVAAKYVRDTNSALKPVDIFPRTTFLGAVSRAVFHQDEKLGRSLLVKHPNASETFGFIDGKVAIWDLLAFAEELDKNHSGILERKIRDVEQEFSSLPDIVQNSSKKKKTSCGA